MSEPIVYDRSPLAAYLEDVGEGGEAWVIEANRFPPSPEQDFAPSSRTIFRSTPTKKTLLTADRSSNQRSRFHTFFATSFSSRLAPRESAKFLEKFRYIICTSPLLSQNISAVIYERKIPHVLRFDFEDADTSSWDKRKIAKYWMGSGGCIVVVSLLITWSLKANSIYKTHTKTRSMAFFVLTLVVALFMHAQSRRAYTRYVHQKSSRLISEMVSHCISFDQVTNKSIKLIQEVELVSRGNQLSPLLPLIRRTENNSRTRKCAAMRTNLSSSLNLLYAAYGRSCSNVVQLTNPRDYQRLCDVYGTFTGQGDLDMSCLFDDPDCLASLKSSHQLVHERRKQLMCCFLSISADGRRENAETWASVVQQLTAVSDLTSSLSKEVQAVLDDDSTLDENLITGPTKSISERHKVQAQGISNLSQILRRTQAKMHILREESSRILQQPSVESDARRDLLGHYDNLGNDLQSLLMEWQDGRELLMRQNGPNTPSETCGPETPRLGTPALTFNTESADEETITMRPSSFGYWGPNISISSMDALDSAEAPFLATFAENPLQEEVYETVSAPRGKENRPQQTSRSERIAQMRKEREVKQAKTTEKQTSQNVVSELKDVLVARNRRPGLKLTFHSQRRSFNSGHTLSPTEDVDYGHCPWSQRSTQGVSNQY